jgi:predicted nucleic acid-binding protein
LGFIFVGTLEAIGATYIVSGDKDLTDFKSSGETKIIKLADFKSMMLYN